MFCTKCGNKLPEDSIFCTQCGQKLKTNTGEVKIAPKAEVTPKPVETPKLAEPVKAAVKPVEVVKPEKKTGAKNIIVIALIVVILIVVLAIVILLFGKKGDTDSREDAGKIEEVDEFAEVSDNEDLNDETSETEEVVEEEKDINPEVHLLYESFIAGDMTAEYNGEEISFASALQDNLDSDASFEKSYGKAVGHRSVAYQYADFDEDGIDEAFYKIINTDGIEDGNESYLVIKSDGETIKTLLFENAKRDSDIFKDKILSENENIKDEFSDVSKEFWRAFPEGDTAKEAMEAYYKYVAGVMKDNADGYITDLKGTNKVDYYFMFSNNNETPMLVFTDQEGRFPTSSVVYVKGQLVRLLFFQKWTFTEVESGDTGGAYKDMVYTTEHNDDGSYTMTFYKIDSSTFGVSPVSLIVNIDGDRYTDEDGNQYESVGELCNHMGAGDDFSASPRMKLF